MKIKSEDFHTVHLKFSEKELKEIDNWRDFHGIRTRSEAIRQMIRFALESRKEDKRNLVIYDKSSLSEKNSLQFLSPKSSLNKNASKKNKDGEDELAGLIKEIVREELRRALEKNK